jgi:hypothetical protein
MGPFRSSEKTPAQAFDDDCHCDSPSLGRVTAFPAGGDACDKRGMTPGAIEFTGNRNNPMPGMFFGNHVEVIRLDNYSRFSFYCN